MRRIKKSNYEKYANAGLIGRIKISKMYACILLNGWFHFTLFACTVRAKPKFQTAIYIKY